VGLLSWALEPFEEPFQSVASPLAVPALAGPLSAVSAVALVLTGLGIPVGAASLVVRFRRSRGVERQQLRWLALAAALLAVVVPTMAALGGGGPRGPARLADGRLCGAAPAGDRRGDPAVSAVRP
jgi:hypothetical protein